jgi:Ca2+/Na+ antiporter
MTTLERTYKQDKKIYIVLLIVYGFLAIVLKGISQDVVTAILFLYVLFLMYLYDKMCVEQDNRYQAISDVLANTSKLYAESQVELLATKAELELYKNHESGT